MNNVNNKEYKIVNENTETTFLIGGVTKVTKCCGYNFGIDKIGKVGLKFCPGCGKRILNINE